MPSEATFEPATVETDVALVSLPSIRVNKILPKAKVLLYVVSKLVFHSGLSYSLQNPQRHCHFVFLLQNDVVVVEVALRLEVSENLKFIFLYIAVLLKICRVWHN